MTGIGQAAFGLTVGRSAACGGRGWARSRAGDGTGDGGHWRDGDAGLPHGGAAPRGSAAPRYAANLSAGSAWTGRQPRKA